MKKILQKIFCAAAFCTAILSATAQQATLMLNEVNPNITSSHDLIELFAVSGGSVNGFTIEQGISGAVVLATLPQVNVSTGELIVVHLNAATATGAAPGSETTSMFEYSSSIYSANYDNAWDFQGGTTGITFSNRVLVVKDSAGTIQDAVPFTNNGGTPAAFPGDVTSIQAQALWLPVDCGGAPCTYATVPTVETISVNWQGVGTTPTGTSVQRLNNTDTNINTDWSSPQAQTWGAVNVGQAVNENTKLFNELTIFPSPVKNTAMISVNTDFLNSEMKIYDITGREVSHLKLLSNRTAFEKGKLQSGMYFYIVTSNQRQTASGKFSIE